MTIAPWPKIKDPKPLRTIDGGTQIVADMKFMMGATDLTEKHHKLLQEAKSQAKVARRMYTAADKMLKKYPRDHGMHGLISSVRKRAYDHTMTLKKTFGKI